MSLTEKILEVFKKQGKYWLRRELTKEELEGIRREVEHAINIETVINKKEKNIKKLPWKNIK